MTYDQVVKIVTHKLDALLTDAQLADMYNENIQNSEREAALIAQEVEDEYYTDEQKEEDATNLCLYTRN